ncbi:restriction endonuclease subunit S [Pseudomonas extremaustralis]
MNSEVKPGYKLTETGVIPEDWSSPCLGLLVHSVEYGSSAKSSLAGKTPVLRMGNLQDGKINWNDLVFTDDDQEISKYLLNSGDVLFNRTNTIELVGKTSIYRGDTPAIFAGYLIRIKERKDLLNSTYLNYVLNSEFSKKYSQKVLSVAVGQANINGQKLKTYPIPLPPSLVEQEAISSALMDTDELISGLEQLITKKRDIKQAAMQHLLTGKQRLPGFSGEWKVKRLGDLAELKQGYSFKSSTYTSAGEFHIVTIANVQNGYMDISGCNKIDFLPKDIQSHQKLKINDILISMTGNVGRVCRVEELGCLLNQRVGKLSTTSIDDNFFFYQISAPGFIAAMTSKAKGGAQANLSTPDITEYLIQAPNSKEEQIAIATILTDIDSELAILEMRYDKARQLKQGMMQELLTGKIRLSQSSQKAKLC